MKVLEPRTIDDSRFISSSVAEPGSGETLWVSGSTYAVGDEVIRAETHRVYRCAVAGVSNTAPELDPTVWVDVRPTNKWAWADGIINTVTYGPSPLQIVVKPGGFSAMHFFGLVGQSITVECRKTTGGDVYFQETYSLDEYLSGDLMWEFFFGEARQRTQLGVSGLYPFIDAEVTITVAGVNPGSTVGIGFADFGHYFDLGVAEYGFQAELVDYSVISTDKYGFTKVKRQNSARNIEGSCTMPAAQANSVLETLNRLRSIPCVWIPSDLPQYDYLTIYGLGSGKLQAESFDQARLSFSGRGLI